MINLSNNTVAAIVRDNKVSFCGLEYLVSDKEAQQLKSIIEGMLNGEVATKTEVRKAVIQPIEKSAPLPKEGKMIYGEDFLEVRDCGDKGIRLYLTVPALIRKKGENDEKKARERAKFIQGKLKDEAKSFGAKWSGNFDKNDFHWTFETKKGAQDYIKARKADMKKRQEKA